MINWDSFYIRQALENGIAGCGDIGVIVNRQESCLCCLIDAVGHGIKAAQQAEIAKNYVEEHSGENLDLIMKGLHRRLTGTQGVVASLIRLDKSNGHFNYCAIGNIGMKILSSRGTKNLEGQEGIIGYSIPTPLVLFSELNQKDVLILYSDGLRDAELRNGNWRCYVEKSAKKTAINMLRAFSKEDDDRSCLILKTED